jgi:hypothetical protein
MYKYIDLDENIIEEALLQEFHSVFPVPFEII